MRCLLCLWSKLYCVTDTLTWTEIVIYTHWPLRYTLLVPGWTLFFLQNCLNLRGIDSTRCWKHCSEILVHIDMIASHSCCRFVGCTSMMRISAEIETHQTRQRFPNLILSNLGDPVWIVFPCPVLIWQERHPGVVFCCWSPSASGFDVLCVQRWYSADLGCNEWLFELLLSFYHL